MQKDYTLELVEDGGAWRWYQMEGPFKCADEGGPFDTRAAAYDDALECCGDVFFEVVG